MCTVCINIRTCVSVFCAQNIFYYANVMEHHTSSYYVHIIQNVSTFVEGLFVGTDLKVLWLW